MEELCELQKKAKKLSWAAAKNVVVGRLDTLPKRL